MTYYEILYWWSFLIIPILVINFAAAIEDSEILVLIPAAWLILIVTGGLTSSILSDREKFIVTSTVETIPVSTTLTKFGLDVVTDENQMIRFNEYGDIQAWKDGAKLYKIYSHKKCNFGIDGNTVEIVFKKVEQ